MPLRFVSLETRNDTGDCCTIYVTSGGFEEDDSAIVEGCRQVEEEYLS